MLSWLFEAAHAPTFREGGIYLLAVSQALILGASAGLLYLALEPYVRRRWPQTLITWSRVLEGRLSDPLVGRDILVGVLFAIGMRLSISLTSSLGSDLAAGQELDAALGVRHMVAFLLRTTDGAVLESLSFFFLIFLFRALLRSQWLASGALILLFAAIGIFGAI